MENDFKKVQVKFCEWMVYCMPKRTNTLKITLNSTVDEEALKKACALAAGTHPMVRCRLKMEGGNAYYEMTDSPFEPVCFDGPYPVGGKDIDGRLFVVSYYDNCIYIAFFHALSDGTGRNRFEDTLLYHYFCIKNNKSYEQGKIILGDPVLRPGQFRDIYDYPDALENMDKAKMPKAPGACYIIPEVLASYEDPFRQTHRFELSLDSESFMAFAKSKGASPTIVFEVMMAQTLKKLNPEISEPIKAMIPVNVRRLADDDIFLCAAVSASQDLDPARLFKDNDGLYKELRSELKEKLSDDELFSVLKAQHMLYEMALKYDSFAQRSDFYRQYYSKMPGTYIFSYVGRLEEKEYSGEIDNMQWTSVTLKQSLPMYTMVEYNGKFGITLIQEFETSRYIDALAEEFMANGIKVLENKILPGSGRSEVYIAERDGEE